MPSHKYDPETYHPQQSYSAKQLSRYDMQVAGVVVYVVAMAVFFVVALVLMLFWNETATQAHAQTLNSEHQAITAPGSAEQRNKLAELTQAFPKPALRAEDINDDIAELHAREDLLLENYTRVDGRPGTVRIPIEHALELMAQRGLPTAPAVVSAPLMTGDNKALVAMPLTSGFARTENEQAQVQR
jgi:hypothetical protein